MESLMTFLCELRRLGARLLAPMTLTAALSAAVLTACGGGTSQVTAFVPDRLIVFGDENSVIESDGRKYSINDLRNTVVANRCLDLPTIVQLIASQYGFVFAQCNPLAATPRAFSFAVVNAKVEDAAAGLAAQVARVHAETGTALGTRDLVSVMIGANDIIDLAERVIAGTLSSEGAVGEAQRRGRAAAAVVNGILGTGARGLVITVPDVGLSPYAYNADKIRPGTRALLAQLSFDYNASLRVGIDASSYDGRNYGLVLADDIVAAIAKNPGTYMPSPANTTVAACTTALTRDCTIALSPTDPTQTVSTLVTGATTNNYLWASDRHLGPEPQSRIGQQARSRAINNPF
jgi:hypothetical protein